MSDTHTEAVEASANAEAQVRFADFGLSSAILQALSDQGYVHPTPIQAKAIPIVMQGRDVMGAAQTGTGKTASFSLPIIQNLLPLANTSASPARHPVRALILTPTRELADQVADNVRNYCRHTPLRSTVVFGGVDMTPQTQALRSGVEILIATPGRLLDHVQQKTLNLSQTQILVLDEADRMLDMGFLPDLQRIVNLLPKKRQSLMFSATFSPEIKKLASSFLNDPISLEVARSNATAERVTQNIYKVGEDDKRDAVVHIIKGREAKQILVFSNTKIGASRLARQLEQEGVKASAIHGDKSQAERMTALDAFKNGGVDVLVATDVAARGLDISDLPCVINYDLPYNAEDYVHRIGRTGRAGASGDAISLYTDRDSKSLADIEKLTRQKFKLDPLPGFVAGRAAPSASWSPRRDESRRDESRGAASSAGGASAARPARGPRAPKVDPWFLKPYEPAPASPEEAEPRAEKAGPPSKAQPKRAALLGGLTRR